MSDDEVKRVVWQEDQPLEPKESQVIPQLDGIVSIGKETLEFAAASDFPFYPKMILSRPGDLQVVQYQSHEELASLCSYLTGHVNWIALTNDGYVLVTTVNQAPTLFDAAGNYLRPLGELFAEGDPRVSEALTVVVVSLDSDLTTTIPYVRKGETIEWGEPEAHSGDLGRVVALLQRTLSRLSS